MAQPKSRPKFNWGDLKGAVQEMISHSHSWGALGDTNSYVFFFFFCAKSIVQGIVFIFLREITCYV